MTLSQYKSLYVNLFQHSFFVQSVNVSLFVSVHPRSKNKLGMQTTDLVELWALISSSIHPCGKDKNPFIIGQVLSLRCCFYWQKINEFLSVNTPTGHDRNTRTWTLQANLRLEKMATLMLMWGGVRGGWGGQSKEVKRKTHVCVP